MVQAYNVLQQLVGDATREVSFDGGNSFRSLTSAEQTKGVEVSVDQKFTVRVSRPHHQPVLQPLVVTDNPLQLGFDGARDFGSVFASKVADVAGASTFQYMAWLTIFRDGDGPRAAAKNTPITTQFMNLLAFQGTRVLAAGGSGFSRFNAVVAPLLAAPTPAQGQLFFALGPDASIPQLVAIFVPSTVDLTQPVPLSIFFCPTTGAKNGTYPFSSPNNDPKVAPDKSFEGVVNGFLIGFNRRLIHQHVLANKQCVLVFPLPPASGYFAGIQDAERLRRYCLEVVFFAQRTVGNIRVPSPALGRCALSCFSVAGVPLSKIVPSSLKGAFPELKEIYCLDVVAPSDNSNDAPGYQTLLNNLGAWLNQDPDRRLRIYTQSAAMNSVAAPIGGPILGPNVGGAVERGTANTTFAFMPQTFWQTVNQEHAGTVPDPNYILSTRPAKAGQPSPPTTFDILHNAFPAIFLEHALQCSGFK
ncbi:MAG: hypothetical protein ABJB12_02345 [Pseudomonadota bacterium]